jgi:uncharacterized protein CbrC (UPF0167 family)
MGIRPALVPLPQFTYHPDPVGNGVIKQEATRCPACNQERPYVYVAGFYSEVDAEGVCPWCIADGSAAAKFQGSFTSIGMTEVASAASIDEVTHKTPGYFSWQEPEWLAHCGECCAFIGYVGWLEISHLEEELSNEIARLKEEWHMDDTEFREVLRKDGDVTGYLFRCIVCGLHRLHIDAS